MTDNSAGDGAIKQSQLTATFGLLVIAGGLLIAGCRTGDPFGCAQALAGEDYAQAALACASAYEQSGRPEYAGQVAQAYYKLHDTEQLRSWGERLAGTANEPGVWSKLGKLLRANGEYRQADAAFQHDYELYRAAHDHLGMSLCQYWRGYVAWETANYRLALEYASASFDAAKKADNVKREINALYLLFSVFQDLGYNDSSEEILGLIKARIAHDDSSAQISYLVNESVLRMSQQRMALARDALQKSLVLTTGQESKRTLRSIYINLIEANLSLGDIDSAALQMEKAWEYMEPGGRVQTPLLLNQALIHTAKGEYDQSLDILQSALSREDITAYWRWQVYHEIGKVAEARSDDDLLVEAYGQAITTLEGFRNTLSLDELRASYLDKKRQPYEALFKYYAVSGDEIKALDIVEKAKARVFLDAYIHANHAIAGSATADAVIQQAPQRFDMLSELLPAMNASPVTQPRQAEQLLRQIGGNYVLVYFETADGLWALVVNADGVKVRLLYSDMPLLRDLVYQFAANPDDARYAATLGALLIPAGLISRSIDKLYIVTDSTVGQVPFPALIVNGRRLVQDYALGFVPSISSLLALEQNDTAPQYVDPVIIGDPLNNLPSANAEALNVGQQLNSPSYIGAHASQEVFFSSANASLLHLATHSGLSVNGPWFSLADGEVTAAMIMAEKISPRLVILASCASGSTDNRGLWGSLGAAFLAAGSAGVLASLWSVDDQATRDFMEAFYRHDALSNPTLALAEVQREFVLQSRPASQWSGFMLLGII